MKSYRLGLIDNCPPKKNKIVVYIEVTKPPSSNNYDSCLLYLLSTTFVLHYHYRLSKLLDSLCCCYRYESPDKPLFVLYC